jgi:hypothetical protein
MTPEQPRTEAWRVRVQLGNWVGYVFMHPDLDAKEAHKLVLAAAWKAADNFTK